MNRAYHRPRILLKEWKRWMTTFPFGQLYIQTEKKVQPEKEAERKAGGTAEKSGGSLCLICWHFWCCWE